MNQKLVAEHLAYLRKSHAWTQEELAEKLLLSRQAVSHWECGESMPDIEALLKLSKLYNVSINKILEPEILTEKLDNFELLHTLAPEDAEYLSEVVSTETLVKAYMATAPENAKWLEENLKSIDFPMERAKIGRVSISDVETAQKEIVSVLNLYMGKMDIKEEKK